MIIMMGKSMINLRYKVMEEVAFGIIAHKVKANLHIVKTVTDKIIAAIMTIPTTTDDIERIINTAIEVAVLEIQQGRSIDGSIAKNAASRITTINREIDDENGLMHHPDCTGQYVSPGICHPNCEIAKAGEKKLLAEEEGE